MLTLGKFLASDEVIQATVDSFHRDLCPYEVVAAQLEECNKNVTKLWPAMAKGLFSSNKAHEMVCQGIKKCNATATASHSLRQGSTYLYTISTFTSSLSLLTKAWLTLS